MNNYGFGKTGFRCQMLMLSYTINKKELSRHNITLFNLNSLGSIYLFIYFIHFQGKK